jgi:hypothetical protein
MTPRPPDTPARGAGAARLRDANESGRARDKAQGPDPAAAPLGTDDEAAGTPRLDAAAGTTLRPETTRTGRGGVRHEARGIAPWLAVAAFMVVGIFLGVWFVR